MTDTRTFAVLRGALSVAFALAFPAAAMAQRPPSVVFQTAAAVPDSKPVQALKLDLSQQIEANKSYAIPAMEIIGFDFLLNRFDNKFVGPEYDVSLSSIRRNLKSSWVVEDDPFQINQLGHPYQGSMYHGFARSAGLSYWEALAYTFAGSAAWEIAGETSPPSWNDQIATGIGGTFLGEALFRMSSLLLENGGPVPGRWRELGAAVISPATGFNRIAFGERFKAIFASRDPAYYSRLSFGFSATTQNQQGPSTLVRREEALTDFMLDYGMPGKRGYDYRRPFDYFTFQGTLSSANALENVMTRGLLIGKDYEKGDHIRGIWGLYGSYDYISPQIFRISSTALSLGTTLQSWLTRTIALQGTLLAGMGYAAVGTIHGTGESDYHYGMAPQGLAALRLIYGERASIDMTAREYFVSRVAGAGSGGRDNIIRTDLAFNLRIHRQHAVSFRYLWNRRHASFSGIDDRKQTRGTFGIFYTLLGHDRFGAVEWR